MKDYVCISYLFHFFSIKISIEKAEKTREIEEEEKKYIKIYELFICPKKMHFSSSSSFFSIITV